MAIWKLPEKPLVDTVTNDDSVPIVQGGKVRRVLMRLFRPNYAENDPAAPGYIADRPCYFTGNIIDHTLLEDVPVALNEAGAGAGSMEVGRSYTLVVNGTGVEHTCKETAVDGTAVQYLGDDPAKLLMEDNSFVAVYGYSFATVGTTMCGFWAADTAKTKAAFGVTDADLAGATIPVSVYWQEREAVKLDPDLLPETRVSNVKLLRVEGEADLTTLDFSRYNPGDVVVLLSSITAADLAGGI